jgi:hypothetical protein
MKTVLPLPDDTISVLRKNKIIVKFLQNMTFTILVEKINPRFVVFGLLNGGGGQ